MTMRSIVLVAHNIRSTLNVGSFLRTADGLGVQKVYLTGYTPYPHDASDKRLPHLSMKIDKQIHKSALGAENSVYWEYVDDVFAVISELKANAYTIIALEQYPNATLLLDFAPPDKVALIIGREVEGIENDVIKIADQIVEIPMLGKKESFNVSVAAAIALYHCRYFD